MLYFVRYGGLLLWVNKRRMEAPPGRSAPEGEADRIGAKAEIAPAPGGEADLPVAWPKLRVLAKREMAVEHNWANPCTPLGPISILK